ncbi:MAG: MBL fold metallo-hydrolase [Deltaproteobacteria bacterium]|nr:MBL fold metallo-hydrolase [Deltaproteobacteria bacterium]MBT4641949.1 MBL fold metallo-hydrolase [Deltaproteobacteria bacterium]MBT6498489.1 MBL fold metallo-hydrolase [Deltaproteobacteria bacterium]MBT7715144.1 MBL fold metallo-hydrolase [Deltaproteobacteria bacterium]
MLSKYPHKVRVEKLDDQNSVLTEFYFRHGANIFVFSYETDGQIKHTFIDTGYLEHQDRILPILRQNQIDLALIENIIITHRHIDHCGLARQLALLSGAKIVVHAGFKSFVEGDLTPQEKLWLGKLDPSRLRESQIEYRVPDDKHAVEIEGIRFPRLGDNIPIGLSGKLEILACPDHNTTHSPDQLIVRYSQSPVVEHNGSDVNHKPSTEDIIFSGDLWLMTGPVFDKNLRMIPLMLKYAFYYFKERMAGRRIIWDDPRDQDVDAKEALKKGFSLIRVKPGHGEEFLGCRIVPNALLADRDLLVKLGYSIGEDPGVLSSEENKHLIAELTENAYQAFEDELQVWLDAGSDIEEISNRLRRIYKEQQGGGKLVAIDRMQRREWLQATLFLLKHDSSAPEQHRQIAKFTDLT